jgi:glycosyltransferase involved in cell wall biosynthesis
MKRVQRLLAQARLVPHYARVFLDYTRHNGLPAAAAKAYQFLFWEKARGNAAAYARWYSRNGVTEPATAAADLFATKSVVIVGTLDLPQCKKYRIIQKLELLENLGVACNISHVDDVLRVIECLQTATHLLLYRLAMTPAVEAYLQEAERLGVITGYDIDDPVFSRSTYEKNRNLDSLASTERDALLRSSQDYLAVMRRCDFVTVSTEPLAALVQELCGTRAVVWRNVIDEESLALAKDCGSSTAPGQQSVTLAYMSGSRAHDRDLEVAQNALAKMLQKHAHMRLLLGGYFTVPAALAGFSDRIDQLPFGSYQAYFSGLARADICIIPLLTDPFNECKSAIRYLEASLMGIPSVVTRVGEFQSSITSDSCGLLASTEAEWETAIDTLVSQPQRRGNVGESARKMVLEKHTIAALSLELQPFLQDIGLVRLEHA